MLGPFKYVLSHVICNIGKLCCGYVWALCSEKTGSTFVSQNLGSVSGIKFPTFSNNKNSSLTNSLLHLQVYRENKLSKYIIRLKQICLFRNLMMSIVFLNFK